MNTIIPAIAIRKASEFGARLLMALYVSWHGKSSHERSERYRIRLAEIELKRRMDNEKK